MGVPITNGVFAPLLGDGVKILPSRFLKPIGGFFK